MALRVLTLPLYADLNLEDVDRICDTILGRSKRRYTMELLKKSSCVWGGSSSAKERNSNLELYRIVVMLMIVAHHYVVNSGLMAADGPVQSDMLAAKSIFILLFGMWGKIGINCFVLITGYFMCESRITVKKYLKLLLEVYFYRFAIYGVFLFCGYQTFKLKEFVLLFFPVKEISDGFTSCFLVFYLTIPFLTILVKNMTKRQHFLLLVLCLFMYSIIGTIPWFGVTFNYVSWFVVLFFIASYLRLYPEAWFHSTQLWGVLTVLSVAVSMCSVLLLTWWEVKTGRTGWQFIFVIDSNKILAVATAVTSFMFFKNLKIKNSKIINSIAASTFGVLLIHANSDAMRQWLWRDTLNNVGAFTSNYMMLHAVASVLGVFLVCTLLDQMRIHFIEKPVMAKLSNYKWFR